jgi:hypothetical protein
MSLYKEHPGLSILDRVVELEKALDSLTEQVEKSRFEKTTSKKATKALEATV